VVFPHGLMFGRVEPERAASIIAACGAGRIELERYRGRTSHPMSVQAADIAVRTRVGLDRIDDVHVVGLDRDGPLVRVRLGVPAGETTVEVERHELPPMLLTCSAAGEQGAVHWVVRRVDLPD
jgi:hypothetical protein